MNNSHQPAHVNLPFRPGLRKFVISNHCQIMYFDDYKKHPNAQLDLGLLWEFNLTDFDYEDMRDIVVERVIQRGWPNDWYFMLNRYGVDGVKAAIKNIGYLNDRDMQFVSHQFNIPLNIMKCYIKKQSGNQHWNS
jgi:hypothetical protein